VVDDGDGRQWPTPAVQRRVIVEGDDAVAAAVAFQRGEGKCGRMVKDSLVILRQILARSTGPEQRGKLLRLGWIVRSLRSLRLCRAFAHGVFSLSVPDFSLYRSRPRAFDDAQCAEKP